MMDLTWLEPHVWPEESYKIGSVRPSLRLSLGFLRIGSLDFFWNYIFVRHNPIFLKKSPSGKNDQKWPKNRIF